MYILFGIDKQGTPQYSYTSECVELESIAAIANNILRQRPDLEYVVLVRQRLESYSPRKAAFAVDCIQLFFRDTPPKQGSEGES